MVDGVIHVVDDDPAMRDSLAFLLEEADLKARIYDLPSALLAASASLEPGCVLTDVRMPEMIPVHFDGQRGMIDVSIGSWGCQVSTGLRNRELQVEVARMAS